MSLTWQYLTGQAIDSLRTLPDGSANTCITSPPYWGLRDYNVEGQIGLEATPELHIARLVEVFREVRRVLRNDGTLWLNYGDAYAGSGKGGYQGGKGTLQGSTEGQDQSRLAMKTQSRRRDNTEIPRSDVVVKGLKPKDLIGLPWMLAFALRADGWYLRSDIIWHKPNPMPESCRDRPTRAHEYIFLFSKRARYYYDQKAISEPASPNTHLRVAQATLQTQTGGEKQALYLAGGAGIGNKKSRDRTPIQILQSMAKIPSGWNEGPGSHRNRNVPGVNPKAAAVDPGNHRGPRPKANASMSAAIVNLVDQVNKRTVWKIPTQPYKGAHFATFPEALVRPCIRAGSPVGGMVLDPFAGTGTVGVVALKEHRSAVLCELSPEYVAMARERLSHIRPLFSREVICQKPAKS